MLVMLLQGWVMAYQSTAMASGIEVCSASGAKRVDREGKPLPSLGHAGHDCCCTAAALPPPVPQDTAAPNLRHEAPTRHLSAGRLAAQWLAPLSRGPPLSRSA